MLIAIIRKTKFNEKQSSLCWALMYRETRDLITAASILADKRTGNNNPGDILGNHVSA